MHWKTSRLITVINSWSNRIPCNCSIWPLVSMNIFSFWHPLREISPSRKLRESATPDRGWSWQCCGWRLMVASQATGPGLPSVVGGGRLVSPGMAGDTVCGWWLPVVVSGCEEGRALAQISSGLPPQSSGGDPYMRGRPFKIKLRTINTETASSTVKCFHFPGSCNAKQILCGITTLVRQENKPWGHSQKGLLDLLLTQRARAELPRATRAGRVHHSVGSNPSTIQCDRKIVFPL